MDLKENKEIGSKDLLRSRIKETPHSPGVYFFKDLSGTVIYIGKAVSLNKRVSSYFQKKNHDPKTRLLVANISDVEYVPTATEAEALIYEAHYIRENKPKYNIDLKDDKSYPYLKLTVKEKYPRLLVVRERVRDRSNYYGPYTNAKLLRQAVGLMRKIFPLRTCSKMPKRPCLNYHIGQCAGPCLEPADQNLYKEIVTDIKYFLSGRKTALLERLSERMKYLSDNMEYEKALKVRHQLEVLSHVLDEKSHSRPLDSDLKELKNILKLRAIPARIEAFDISCIMGTHAVGSMVAFFDAKPLKKDYRRFRIRTVGGIDDYAMIKEVVRRRYTRIIREGKKMPDLVLIDGGLGHLNAALGEMKALGLNIPVISIAKREEKIYAKGSAEPIILDERSKAKMLIQRVRDEAHRFAISYHKLLRSKGVLGEK